MLFLKRTHVRELSFLEHGETRARIFRNTVSIWETSQRIILLLAGEVINLLLASSAEGNHLSMKEVGLTFLVCD